MVNIYRIKKYLALLMLGAFPAAIMFILFLIGVELQVTIASSLVTMGILVIFFNMLTRHPMIDYLEGQGLLMIKLDSTGVMQFIIAQLRQPYIESNVGGHRVETLYDRNLVHYITKPFKRNVEVSNLTKDGKEFTKYEMLLPKGDESIAGFMMDHYPVLIYNQNMGSFITKNDLGKMETTGTIAHGMLYLDRKTDELTSIMRDFARSVMELFRPGWNLAEILNKWWFWVVVVILMGLGLYVAWPYIEQFLGMAKSTVAATPGIGGSTTPPIVKPT